MYEEKTSCPRCDCEEYIITKHWRECPECGYYSEREEPDYIETEEREKEIWDDED